MQRKKPYDPLVMIPPPEAIRARLIEAEALAHRFRILLDLAERLRQPPAPTDAAPVRAAGEVAVA